MKAIKLTILLLFSAITVFAQKEQDTCVHLHEVVVTGLTGTTHINHIPAPVSVISAQELQTLSASNIIDAITRQPGVSQITTGNGISKPVIRGLGYNRVLVVNDGIRQEGQQWGDEHGVEVDGEGVHSVEIMKGPASLMYGSDAMAGVVVFHDAPIQPLGTMKANVIGGWQSNANLWNYSVNFAGNQQGFVWDGRWSQKGAGEYENSINHKVENSQFTEQAARLMMGFNKRWGFSHLKLSYYHIKPGIVGEHHHDHDDNDNVNDNPNNDGDHHHDADHEHEHEGEEHEHEAPFQHVRHYKVTLDNSFNIGESRIKALLAYQQNRRQEYEAPDEVGQDFRLHTVNYDLRYVSPAWNGWTMNAGVNGMWQESQNLGHEFLIPAYHLFDFGIFATAAKDFAERLHISGGLRFDNRHLHSNALEEKGQMRFQQFSRNFNGVTGSIGAIYNITPNFDVRVNAARGFRAPNLSELGSFGIHHGTLRFEQGNHDLKPEGSWQFDLGMDYSSEIFSAKLALFANTISNFIFLEKTGSVIDGNDVFGYHQGDAQLLGFEGTVILHPIHHLHFENTFSYVDARQKNQPEEAKYLPFTPAPRWRSSLHYHFNIPSETIKETFAEIEMDCNLKQDHIHSIHNTETRTPSYTLWNASAGTDIHIRGRKLLSVALTAQNIFNRAYQHHLSRLKEAGIYNMGRNIGVKVAVPITL